MSVDFQHSIEIDKAADEVFSFVADFENNPTWQGGMQSCEWTSNEKLCVGATYVQRARFMGKRIETHFRVSAYEPGHMIAIESTVSTFPIQVTRTVEDLGSSRCRVTAHVRGQPTGVLKLFSGMVNKSVRKDYDKLKRLLENE